NIAIAGLIRDTGFNRWKGHDMQVRPYDNEEQGIDRVIRSVLSWEACAQSSQELDKEQLMKYLADRETAKAEDIMREALTNAQKYFNRMYKE
ncbi:MAG: xylose isomerase, partial [Atribacterota bacterium]